MRMDQRGWMQRSLRVLTWRLSCALLLLGPGCGANEAGLTHDIRVLLDGCGVKPQTIQVTMGDRSRTGIVEFPASVAEVEAIVSALDLRETAPGDSSSEIKTWLGEGVSQFDHSLLAPPNGVRVFCSSRRANSLRLSSGSSFEYLLLFWDEASGVALIQVSYAYG